MNDTATERMTAGAVRALSNRDVCFVGSGLPSKACNLAPGTHGSAATIVSESGAIEALRLNYTATEMMTVGAARALSNRDVCFVGIGLPSKACNLAPGTHGSAVTIVSESGAIEALRLNYTATEMMTAGAARALSNRDVCFVGIGLPSAACNLAPGTHGSAMTIVSESGAIEALRLNYTATEMMTAGAVRALSHRDVCFVGSGLPSKACNLAPGTHGSAATIVSESGAIEALRLNYTATEMMTAGAARALSNRDVCFVGIGLPSAACNLAPGTHGSAMTIVSESGAIEALR